jgi:hypothetical protein
MLEQFNLGVSPPAEDNNNPVNLYIVAWQFTISLRRVEGTEV